MSTSIDHLITQSWLQRHRGYLLSVGAAATLLTAIVGLTFSEAGRSTRLRSSTLTIAPVESGIYHNFIPVRARVVPRNTVYLDALEGGRVDRVLVEPGDLVTAGQPLVEFSNTALELDVLERDARFIESITQLQTYQTQLEQNRLSNLKTLAQIDYSITKLRRAIERRRQLTSGGVEARETLDTMQDELDYQLGLRPLQAGSNEQQNVLRLRQAPQIEAQLEKLHQDIAITRSKLDNLIVRASVSGRMTAIDLKVGENRNRGERLGEITPDNGIKLSAQIDEFYLDRLYNGLRGTVDVAGHVVTLRVTRVYPQVNDGVFTVDLDFDSEPERRLLPGQSLQGRIALGDDTPAVLVPAAAFLERTGGRWIFVLEPDGRTARRREIGVGRRNSEQVEILSGLKPGERVIVSDYGGVEQLDRIDIQKQ